MTGKGPAHIEADGADGDDGAHANRFGDCADPSQRQVTPTTGDRVIR